MVFNFQIFNFKPKMNKRLLTAVLISYITCTAVWAVMPYYVSARAEGMGEAFTSLSCENSGLFYNPAGLAAEEKKEVSAMLWNDYFGTGYSFLSCGSPCGSWGGVSAGWARTSNTFEQTDSWGNVVGQADISNDIYMIGAGYKKGLPVSLGLTAKFITEKIGSFSVSGWALDMGSFVEVKSFRFGILLQNAVSGGLNGNSLYSGGSVSENIPAAARLGLSYTSGNSISLDPAGTAECAKNGKLNIKFTIATDVDVPADNPGNYTFSPGAEIWFDDYVAVRAGYRELKDYTTGFSLKIGFLRLDYAFIISKELENSNIFSTSLFF
jgi:hypothetical protein